MIEAGPDKRQVDSIFNVAAVFKEHPVASDMRQDVVPEFFGAPHREYLLLLGGESAPLKQVKVAAGFNSPDAG